MKRESGITLVEIMVSTIVLSVVLLSAGTIYVAAIRELQRVTDEARVQMEVSYALDHIFLELLQNGTDITTPAADGTPNDSIIYSYRKEDGSTGTRRYQVDGGNAINFYSDSVLQEKIAELDSLTMSFSRPLKLSDEATTVPNYVAVTIGGTKGRMSKTYRTGVCLRSMSI